MPLIIYLRIHCISFILSVSGEAAGLAMGLVMLGTKHANAIEDMLAVSISTYYCVYTSYLRRN